MREQTDTMGRDFEFLEAARGGDLLYFEKFFANKKAKALQRYFRRREEIGIFLIPGNPLILSAAFVGDQHRIRKTRVAIVPSITLPSMDTCKCRKLYAWLAMIRNDFSPFTLSGTS